MKKVKPGDDVICTTNPEFGIGRCTLFSPSNDKVFIVYNNEKIRYYCCTINEVKKYENENR